MIDHLRRMAELIRAVEKVTGTDFKVAGFGNGETLTYCLVITARDNADMLAMMEACRMITDGVLVAMRMVAAQEEMEQEETEVIKH
jgi:hypothetical protein